MSSIISSVFLAEDEPNAFERCAQIIEMHPRLELKASATSLREALALLQQDSVGYDLLVTDLRLGDGDGADLIRHWRSKGGKFAMVVTVFGDVDSVMRSVEAGADGYMLKSGTDYEMITAITTVLDGGSPISASVAGHLLKRLRNSGDADRMEEETDKPQLSAREIDILSDLARGLSYKEVARFRSISPHTVADHVKAIYRKMAVNSRGEAVFQAIQNGIIDLKQD
ncbi:response regulator transcription factor [Parasphingorhabdus sp.]|uniref:response regulator transcription factor n=1 Tax=Parasphingorhabdus sp. TaxID=2709688 RepID=UPI003263357C